jgi:hypothetical protein
MTTLCFFGTRVHEDVGGRAAFLTLFFGSGMVGMLTSMAWFTLRGILVAASLGASGATIGIMATYFWLHRTDTFKFGHYPPEPFDGVPGIVFLAIIAGSNLAKISKILTSKVDRISHVAGGLFGITYVEILRKCRQAQAQALADEDVARDKRKVDVADVDAREYVEWAVIDMITGKSRVKREPRLKSDRVRSAEEEEEERTRLRIEAERKRRQAQIKVQEEINALKARTAATTTTATAAKS